MVNNKLELPIGIFNTALPELEERKIILGQEPGLLDTINRTDEVLFKHYKNLKDLDWDENEFRYALCLPEFAAGDEDAGIMIDTIAWQWETDTVIARILMKVIGSFVTDSDAIIGYSKIMENEQLHALTYSEIAKTAFTDPNLIMNQVLMNKEAHARLLEPALIFEEARIAACKYELGLITREEVLPTAILFFAALPTLERAQFMPSFAVTFAYGEVGRFRAVANGIQKICQDEFEVHIPFNKAVFLRCIATHEGRKAFEIVRPRIITLLNAINKSEFEWVDQLFNNRRSVAGLTKESLSAYNDYSATDMALFFGIEDEVSFEIIKQDPLPYMKGWINISKTQKSPQEEDPNQYKLNIVERNDHDLVYDTTFLG